MATRRRQAQRKGGQRTRYTAKAKQPADIATVAAVQTLVAQVLADLLLRPNTEQRASAVKGLCELAYRMAATDESDERLEKVELILKREGFLT